MKTARRSSSEVVGSIDDLMLQILLRLRAKPLTRLKLVSKRWESLITTHHASFLRNQGPLGLICPSQRIPSFEFIPVDDVRNPVQPPFLELRFPGEVSGGLHWVSQSCNGLLLCCNGESHYVSPTPHSSNFRIPSFWFPKLSCCVYNPTTKCFARVPRPDGYPHTMLGLNLAYDPAKSPGYKVLLIRKVALLVQVEIYSSESEAWRLCGEPFSAKAIFSRGVYWNGSINWISRLSKELLYFNVDKEELGKVSFPPTLKHEKKFPTVGYFGESGDHLHVVEIRGAEIPVFDVHEMRRDYSGWFVRYRVDLSKTSNIEDGYHIFHLFRGEERKCRSFLLLTVSGKLTKWNLDRNTVEEIVDNQDIGTENRFLPLAFEFIESLGCV